MTTNTQKRSLVQINYKSGTSVEQWFDKFKINYRYQGEIESIKWVGSDEAVYPLYLGVDQVESVWVLKTEEVTD